MDEQLQLCSFFLADMCYGLRLEHVLEVSRSPHIVPVPCSAPSIAGLMNLRGKIITAIDLRVRLGLAKREDSEESMLVLCQDSSEELVGLQVDKIEDVVFVAQRNFETSPNTLPSATREIVPGAYKDESRLIMLLELAPLLNFVE